MVPRSRLSVEVGKPTGFWLGRNFSAADLTRFAPVTDWSLLGTVVFIDIRLLRFENGTVRQMGIRPGLENTNTLYHRQCEHIAHKASVMCYIKQTPLNEGLRAFVLSLTDV